MDAQSRIHRFLDQIFSHHRVTKHDYVRQYNNSLLWMQHDVFLCNMLPVVFLSLRGKNSVPFFSTDPFSILCYQQIRKRTSRNFVGLIYAFFIVELLQSVIGNIIYYTTEVVFFLTFTLLRRYIVSP